MTSGRDVRTLPSMDSIDQLDPDWRFVPPTLAALDGKAVRIEGVDRASGERVVEQGSLLVVPGYFRPTADDGPDPAA